MPGVRLDQFLASTAIVVLLSATAGGGVADPMNGGDTAVPAMTAAPETEGDSAQAAAKRGGPTDEAPAPDASAKPNQSDTAAKPHQSGEQPAAAAAAPPAKPDQATDQPASTAATPATPAKPEQATDQPAAPATTVATPSPAPAAAPNQDQAAEKPAAPAAAAIPNQQPAGAPGESGAPTTATIAPAAATPAPVADGNTPIAEQLRGLAGGKFDRIIGGKKDRATIDAFYSGRDYAPLWLSDGKPNAKAKAATAYLGQVDADGLDPADYQVPDFASLTDPAALAEAEMRLTTSIITYAHHAQIGRVHWTRVSGDIFYDQKAPEPADILAAMVDAKDIAQVLDGYEPHAPGYLALKAKLAELRAGKDSAAHAQIPTGPMPKIGAQDDRVPQLRERLGLPADSDTTYDKTLAAAVKKFQQERELKPTGTLTAATVDALNGRQPDRPIDTIIANLERWRWIPHDLGKTYVMVNLPDFTLRVFHDGKQVWMTRIVDGKPAMPTPIMTAEMKYITVNPTWNVPPSIVAKEYLPALAAGPDGAGTDGTAGQPQSRRHRAHLPAARRQERARPAPLQLPQQVPGLSARHAGQVPVRLRPARVQPWLHARAGSGEICRGAAVDRAPGRRLHRGPHPQDVRQRRTGHPVPEIPPRPSHLSDRVRGRGRQAPIPRGHLRPRQSLAGDPQE